MIPALRAAALRPGSVGTGRQSKVRQLHRV